MKSGRTCGVTVVSFILILETSSSCIRLDRNFTTKQNEEEDDTTGTSSQGMHDTSFLMKVPAW